MIYKFYCLNKIVIFILLVSIITLKANSQIINTVVGDLNFGNGGLATSATLSYPESVTVDGSGNIYIADNQFNVIRKISVNGIISTVAGNGTGGFSGDGGAAINASLYSPSTVAVDVNGNIYIADEGNGRIRKVDLNGIISTVAGNGTQGSGGDGGSALNASLSYQFRVNVDINGNVYIADYGNSKIRKVSSSGIISTVAGNGIQDFKGDGGAAINASLDGPYGLCFDASGSLYIADNGNNRIRKVSVNGVISTVAGNGTQGFSGDGGTATSASINTPLGVVVDVNGNIYIADAGNNRIRKVSASGVISTIAGNGIFGFTGDGGKATSARMNNPNFIAIDSTGNLYISDNGNQRIRKIDVNGIINTIAGIGTGGYGGDGKAATNANLNSPIGIAVDGNGNLYIADENNNRVRKVGKNGIISTIAGSGTAGYSGDGKAATNANLFYPSGVAVDSFGNLYIADRGNNRIRKVSNSGIITTVAGNGINGYGGDGGVATSATFSDPIGVAVDDSGNLYIADYGNNRIRKVGKNGIINTVAGVGGQGFNGDGGAATNAVLSLPSGVAVDDSGNLYIADAGNNRIRQVNVSGIITTVVGNGMQGFSGDGGVSINAKLNYPFAITVDKNGNIYIADAGNSRIRKVGANKIINTVAGNGIYGYGGDGGVATNANLNYPEGVAVFRSENLYIGDLGNNIVRNVLFKPIITSFTPMKASIGSIVTIVGGNFTGTLSVSLGGVTASSFVVVNDSTIKAVVGSSSSGYVSILTSGGIDSLFGFVFVSGQNSITGRVVAQSASAFKPISGATVKLSVDKLDSTFSSSGTFMFNYLIGGNYKMTATKNNDINKTNGVTTLDLALVQSHILGKSKLNNPYKIIAADVNGDGKITTLDLVYIKRLILGIDTTFTNSTTKENRLWAFVDSTYSFPDTTNPFPFKDSISYIGLSVNKTNQTFIGVKLGDVNWDWNPALARMPSKVFVRPKKIIVSEK